MKPPADYHMHTPLCHHAVGEPTDLAAHAVKAGLTEIGFSEHNPMIRDDWDNWHMELENLDRYLESVEQARKDHPRLTIRDALEVDYLPGHEDWIRELASRHEWDYFIGSVHYISDDFDLDNPEKKDEWQRRDFDDVWLAYFDRLTAAAESGLFQIIGHADLCKKFKFYPKNDPFPAIERFLQSAAAHDVAIEINTAGLRKDCKEMYPHPKILRRARELDVPLTFASDAHAPDEVGADFEAAVRLAQNAGYRFARRFEKRKAIEVALDL